MKNVILFVLGRAVLDWVLGASMWSTIVECMLAPTWDSGLGLPCPRMKAVVSPSVTSLYSSMGAVCGTGLDILINLYVGGRDGHLAYNLFYVYIKSCVMPKWTPCFRN